MYFFSAQKAFVTFKTFCSSMYFTSLCYYNFWLWLWSLHGELLSHFFPCLLLVWRVQSSLASVVGWGGWSRLTLVYQPRFWKQDSYCIQSHWNGSFPLYWCGDYTYEYVLLGICSVSGCSHLFASSREHTRKMDTWSETFLPKCAHHPCRKQEGFAEWWTHTQGVGKDETGDLINFTSSIPPSFGIMAD